MTTEDSATVLDISEIRLKYLRIIRLICDDEEDGICRRTVVLVEERFIEERPEKFTGKSILDKAGIGRIGISRIIAYAEDEDVNAAAQVIYTGLLGRMDERRVINMIERLISESGKLALAVPVPLD
ncbi:MAG: hypothetical protein KBD19_03645 [Candidatus Moranbacteria bacterium]|nr:hypothetical protein [Candidatus Moranbacteria bacterium]